MTEHQQLEAAIAGLGAQRALLGDAVVDAALGPMRARLAHLAAEAAALTLPAATQQLKLVTVLFADIVGSTRLAERLDAEDMLELSSQALARLASVVEQHQGRVLRFTGDGLKAVFGAELTQEDDPERAVHCGLALLAAAADQAALVRQRWPGADLAIRVGINTGPAALGGGIEGADTVMGSTVNLAARMEQAAPIGGLRISQATHGHVRGLFEVVAQPPLQLKGFAQPVASYLVERARPRAFRRAGRGVDGVETPMVGRDAELAALQQAVQRLQAGAGLASITLVADAGIGKSRLLHELTQWLPAQPQPVLLLRGRAQPQSRHQPYGLLRELLAGWLQISDGHSMAQARQRVEQGIAPLFAADDGDGLALAHAHLLGHLIGLDFADSPHLRGILDDVRQIRNRAFHAAAQVLRRLACQAGAPLLLVLDDLHWADDGTLDFLAYLAQVNHDQPLLLLALTRPELFERRPDGLGLLAAAEADAANSSATDAPHQRITLQPLDLGLSRLLARQLLQPLAEVPASLLALLTDGAEGNPFYMEELVRMLVDEGAIQTGGAHWALVPDKLRAARLPQTLTGVLQARLDKLPPADKLALQQASVVGLVFWDQALAALDANAPAALPSLVQRALVLAQPEGRVDGQREYRFKHQTLQQVTYDTLPKRWRRAHHRQAARWMAGLVGARANDFLGATADHFERAGDIGPAISYLARAAEHAAGRYAHEAALAHVARGLALLDLPAPAPAGDDATDSAADNTAQPDPASLRWRLLDVRERTLDLQGRRAEQAADIDALQALAQAWADDRRLGEVALRRSSLALRTTDFRRMAASARDTVALATRAGDAALALRGQQRLAGALALQGDTAQAKPLAQAGLAAARAQGLLDVEALFLNALALIASLQDDLMAKLDHDQQHVQVVRALGNRRFEATALGNLGGTWLDLGDHPQARRDLSASLKLTRALGDRASEPFALTNLALLALRQGDDAQALAQAQAALDAAVAVRDPANQAMALVRLGQAELALGRLGAAAAAFDRAHAVAAAIGHDKRHDAAAGLARVALARGDGAGALQAITGLLAHLAAGGGLDDTDDHLIRLTCWQVLARANDARAPGLLASAQAALLAEADAIPDAGWRQRFLRDIPEHRAIVAAVAGLSAAPAA